MHRIVLLFLIFSTYCNAQLSEVKRITEELCAPKYDGRGYVNDGDDRAADFIASEFEKLGVEKLGESYFQPFELSVNTFPNRMNVTYNGQQLETGKHFIVHSMSSGFNGQLVPSVIDSSILLSESQMQRVFESIQSEQTNTFLIDTRGLTAKTEAKMQAELLGLSAYAPVVFLTHQKFTWSVGRNQAQNPILIVQDSIYKKDEIFRVNIDARYEKKHSSKNVIAHIPAEKKCAKTIVFTAHYDHLGRMGKDTYFPGANDNASGTAMIISMAQYFKAHPSEYNIVFIAFAGEEAGLVGSKYFTENPMFKLRKIKFLINLDIMGSGEEGITVVNATEHEKEYNLMVDINRDEDLLAKVKKRGPTQNSDHYYFTQKGVPAFFIYTMGPNKHYHDIFDTYDELSFKAYEDIKTLLVRFVELL